MPVTDIDPSIDYYQCLGVAADADPGAIRAAYRVIAKTCHPDLTGGDAAKEARFKLCSVAYGVLGDPAKRAQYDAARAFHAAQERRQARPAAPGRGGPGQTSPAQANHGQDRRGSFDLGSLFSELMGGELGQEIGREIKRDLGSMVREAAQAVDPEGYPTAGPTRKSRAPRQARSRTPRRVEACDGSALDVDGADVRSRVTVSLATAVLGGVVTVATLAGRVEARVPPGTPGGSSLRLRGRGLPVTDDEGVVGDHHVTILVDVPRGDEAKAQLRAILVALHGGDAAFR